MRNDLAVFTHEERTNQVNLSRTDTANKEVVWRILMELDSSNAPP